MGRKTMVVENSSGERVDVYLSRADLGMSRSHVQRLISAGLILINDVPTKPHQKVRPGDRISLVVPEPKPPLPEPEEIPLDVLYEDGDLLVVNKPAEMVVHPAGGNFSGTLVNALLYRCRSLSTIGGPLRPGIVHRLDKGTSGLLVVAKSDGAHRDLSRQLERKTMARQYRAIVWEKLASKGGTIQAPIGRHRVHRQRMAVIFLGGREAITSYRVLEEFDFCTHLSLRLKTGRTHQIRVHLSHLGHPILGDPKYGGRGVSRLELRHRELARRILGIIGRQALHAERLGFTHPRSRQHLEFSSPPPADIQDVLRCLRAEAAKE